MKTFYLFLLTFILTGCLEANMSKAWIDDQGIVHAGDEAGASGGWSASNELVSGNADESAQLQVNFEKSGAYTIQFSLDLPVAGIGDVVAVADVDWKVEGNWVHRTLNVMSGTSISGTAEAVKVVVRDATLTIAGIQYRASIQVASGTRPSIQQPPIYQPDQDAVTIAPGADTIFAVPQDCGIVSVWLSAIVAAAVPSIPVAGSVTAIFNSTGFSTNFADVTRPQWFPIPPGVTSIRIFNSGASNVTVNGPIYGIDG
jgi:hypothetical protein